MDSQAIRWLAAGLATLTVTVTARGDLVDDLLQRLQSTNEEVRAEAADALARVGGPRAAQEFRAMIAADNPDAAARVRLTILYTADFIAQHPEIGRRIRNAAKRHQQIRWFVAPKFRNYLIFYRPFRETVVVIRVLHAARDWTRFFPAA